MGYSYRNNGGIKDYWPDNDKDTLYLEGRLVSTLLESIREHFGEAVDFDILDISPECIQTYHLTYDLYDPNDYTKFLVITRRKVLT